MEYNLGTCQGALHCNRLTHTKMMHSRLTRKTVLLLTIVMLFSASLVFAQGSIGAVGDTGGVTCQLAQVSATTTVYVMNVNDLLGAMGYGSSVPDPVCVTGFCSDPDGFFIILFAPGAEGPSAQGGIPFHVC